MRQNHFAPFRYAAFVLVCVLLTTSVAFAADVPLDPVRAKQMLSKRGIGKMVKVQETDGPELRGRIVSIGETSVVLQPDSNPAIEVPYDKVAAVKGPGLSKGAKIGIWVGVGIMIGLGILGTRV